MALSDPLAEKDPNGERRSSNAAVTRGRDEERTRECRLLEDALDAPHGLCMDSHSGVAELARFLSRGIRNGPDTWSVFSRFHP